MQKQQTRTRGRKPASTQTFLVSIGGHQIAMARREQVIANGQGWKRCHGEHDGTKVNSLSIKRFGNKIFIKDDGKLAGYDLAELAVALPEIQGLISSAKDTTISQ